eukprot:jgi/Mesvir1/16795/Mv15164-RA.1
MTQTNVREMGGTGNLALEPPTSRHSGPPRILDVETLSSSRALEMLAVGHALRDGGLEGNATFGAGALARHLRRRTASHKPYRVHNLKPSKKRKRALVGDIPGSPTSLLPNRHQRRREKFRRIRQGQSIIPSHAEAAGQPVEPGASGSTGGQDDPGEPRRWLPTHSWHAKRFEMRWRWGVRVAEGLPGRGRGSRAVLRGLRTATLAHDTSMMVPIQVAGPQEAVCQLLRSMAGTTWDAVVMGADASGASPSSLTTSAAGVADAARDSSLLSGRQEACLMLHGRHQHPAGAIAPVHVLFQPRRSALVPVGHPHTNASQATGPAGHAGPLSVASASIGDHTGHVSHSGDDCGAGMLASAAGSVAPADVAPTSAPADKACLSRGDAAAGSHQERQCVTTTGLCQSLLPAEASPSHPSLNCLLWAHPAAAHQVTAALEQAACQVARAGASVRVTQRVGQLARFELLGATACETLASALRTCRRSRELFGKPSSTSGFQLASGSSGVPAVAPHVLCCVPGGGVPGNRDGTGGQAGGAHKLGGEVVEVTDDGLTPLLQQLARSTDANVLHLELAPSPANQGAGAPNLRPAASTSQDRGWLWTRADRSDEAGAGAAAENVECFPRTSNLDVVGHDGGTPIFPLVVTHRREGAPSALSADSLHKRTRTGTTTGNSVWTLVVPAGWATRLWVALVLAGAHAIGLRERRWVAVEMGAPSFPMDFPETAAHAAWVEQQRKEAGVVWGRTPASKRGARQGPPQPPFFSQQGPGAPVDATSTLNPPVDAPPGLVPDAGCAAEVPSSELPACAAYDSALRARVALENGPLDRTADADARKGIPLQGDASTIAHGDVSAAGARIAGAGVLPSTSMPAERRAGADDGDYVASATAADRSGTPGFLAVVRSRWDLSAAVASLGRAGPVTAGLCADGHTKGGDETSCWASCAQQGEQAVERDGGRARMPPGDRVSRGKTHKGGPVAQTDAHGVCGDAAGVAGEGVPRLGRRARRKHNARLHAEKVAAEEAGGGGTGVVDGLASQCQQDMAASHDPPLDSCAGTSFSVGQTSVDLGTLPSRAMDGLGLPAAAPYTWPRAGAPWPPTWHVPVFIRMVSRGVAEQGACICAPMAEDLVRLGPARPAGGAGRPHEGVIPTQSDAHRPVIGRVTSARAPSASCAMAIGYCELSQMVRIGSIQSLRGALAWQRLGAGMPAPCALVLIRNPSSCSYRRTLATWAVRADASNHSFF